MPCYHPLKRFSIATDYDGKSIGKVVPYGVVALVKCHPGDSWHAYDFVPKSPQRYYRVCTEYDTIPCGQCIGCRLEYSRQWANRCMLELQYHKSSYFVTFTYNEDFVPRSYYANPDTGEALPSLTLRKRDWQLFMKRLRKAFPDQKIRFFCCGEYGPETFRPHYHAILFGLELDDLVFYKQSQGFNYYTSDKLQRCWSALFTRKQDGDLPQYVSMGRCLIANVTWETCAYTARYITKKLTGPEATFYTDFNIEPPFVLMSRKPGIARQYYDDHPDVMDYEYINVKTDKGGRKFRPPKYYDRLFDVDEPERSAELKAVRKRMAEAAKDAKLSQTSLSYLELLQVEEDVKLDAIKSLDRSEL